MTRTIRDKLIKLLGGYTPREYSRIEQKYQGLLDSKSDVTNMKLVNEYLCRALRDLDRYMRSLYGEEMPVWVNKVWNVIHNNWLRLEVRYWRPKSAIPYKIDTTLEDRDEFIKVLQSGDEQDEIEYILQNLVETD